jgi:hypothetical protein
MWIEYQQGLREFLGLLGREQKRVGRIEPSWLSKWIAGWVFLKITTSRERGLEMTVVGLAVVGVILGAAGMQFLQSTNPEIVEKVEDDIKRFINSMSLTKSENKKEKDK